MDHPTMPLTSSDLTSSDLAANELAANDLATDEVEVRSRMKAELDDGPGSDRVGDQSGYDVVTSAASPRSIAAPTRWDQFVLFNVVIPILLVLAGVAIYYAMGEAEAKPVPPPDTSRAAYLEALKETRVEQIRSLDETGKQLELVIDGTVVPYQEAQVSSEVSGRVIGKSPNCETGAIVTKGDVLMQIDTEDYQLEVERLEKQLESEDRTLAEVDQEMKNAEASRGLAEKDFKLQQKEVTRVSKLRDLKNFASQAEVDRAESASLQAEQQLLSLQNQLKLLASRKTRLETSKKLVDKQLEVAKLNLSRCKVSAPISGVIVSEQADVNTFVNRGTPLVTIEDTSKVEVAASMRMDQLHWVLDQDVSVESDSEQPSGMQTSGGRGAGYDLPDTEAIIEYEVAGLRNTTHRWKGTLVSYAGIGIDPKTRTAPVRLLVEQPTHYVDEDGNELVTDRTNALVRGMFVRVRLMLKPKSELVVIPASALRPGNKVWRFQCDDSIIDKMMEMDEQKQNDVQLVKSEAQSSEVASPSAASTSAASTSAASTSTARAFDASEWSAGNVNFSKPVYPIDSLRLGGRTATDSASDPSNELGGVSETNLADESALKTIGRFWICKADEGDLEAGDYVVVSPLDSVPSDGLPARAKIEQ